MILETNTLKNLSRTTSIQQPGSLVTRLVIVSLWSFFLGSLLALVYVYPDVAEWRLGNILRFNGFTLLIWTTVGFFSAIVGSYAGRYLNGFKFQSKFMMCCLGFTLSVMLLVLADHVALFVLSWCAMGLLMSQLIGIDRDWKEARAAARFTRRYFLLGSLALGIGLAILAYQAKVFTISGLMASVDDLPVYSLVIAALCIIFAAIVQSAIYPFHRWLLSAMTAPTPASALMHAGFVNGAGILLAIFSTVLFTSNTLDVLLIIGGLTAIIAQFTKLLQVNVKQKLACSTIAQMGFMIMQCGLGFFNAAVVHLILHGFYKAYLFLASGEEIAHTRPEQPPHIRIRPLQALAVLLFGVAGAYLFTWATGKGMHLDSGIFLTLIVAITVGQFTYNFVKQQRLTLVQKLLVPAGLFMLGIGVYALLYNCVTELMSDMPMTGVATPLSTAQIVFAIIFLIGFFVMKLGIYRRVPWLYVKLMNASQPYNKTILTHK